MNEADGIDSLLKILKEIPAVGPGRARAYQVLLVLFRVANKRALYRPDPWTAALGCPSTEAVQHMVDHGFLCKAPIQVVIESRSRKELLDMLQERRLPVTGNKVVCAARLITADPSSMQAIADRDELLLCTDIGRTVAEHFLEEELSFKRDAHATALTAIEAGNYLEAVEQAQSVLARRVVGGGDDLFGLYPERCVSIITRIMAARPTLLRDLPEPSWEPLRLAASMDSIFQDKAETWIPAGTPAHPRLSHDACCRMLLFSASQSFNLSVFRASDYVRAVKLLTGPDLCEACSRDDQIEYSLDDVPELPHAECTCKIGCPCGMVAVVSKSGTTSL